MEIYAPIEVRLIDEVCRHCTYPKLIETSVNGEAIKKICPRCVEVHWWVVNEKEKGK